MTEAKDDRLLILTLVISSVGCAAGMCAGYAVMHGVDLRPLARRVVVCLMLAGFFSTGFSFGFMLSTLVWHKR